MKKMIFVSRHSPSGAQSDMAQEQGYDLLHVGDVNAFDVNAVRDLIAAHQPDAVACVHPVVALTAVSAGCAVGIFENANRAPEGAPPKFEAAALHIYVASLDGAALVMAEIPR